MAKSTAITTPSYSTLPVTTYAKLVNIVNYPDLGSSPSKLDTTDLTAAKVKTSILGLQETPDLTFECNYDEAKYAAIVALAGQDLGFELGFGVGNVDGKFTWQGQVAVFANGAGVDEVRKMTVTCSASTEIVFATVA